MIEKKNKKGVEIIFLFEITRKTLMLDWKDTFTWESEDEKILLCHINSKRVMKLDKWKSCINLHIKKQ